MLSRILKVLAEEGPSGIVDRLKYRLDGAKWRLYDAFGGESVLSRYGFRFRKNWLDSTFRFYVNGSYGDDLVSRLRAKDEPFVFLDIGANQGLYTICAASNPHCVGAYAFEPVSRTFALLRDNVALNRVEGKCVLVKKAIGTKPQVMEIKVRPNHSGGASLHHDFEGDDRVAETIEVIDGAGLDGIVSVPGAARVFCKIDVEGFEAEVLRALTSSALARSITEIFYEVDEDWVDPGALEALLRAAGFTRFEKIGAKPKHYDVMATR
jgi:FkbM family methyltransferase